MAPVFVGNIDRRQVLAMLRNGGVMKILNRLSIFREIRLMMVWFPEVSLLMRRMSGIQNLIGLLIRRMY